FKLIYFNDIKDRIIKELDVENDDAINIIKEVAELLCNFGVVEIDGHTNKLKEYSPDFQVSDVENVLVIATTQKCNLSCPMCYAMAEEKMSYEMNTLEIKSVIDQLDNMPLKNNISRVALTGGEFFSRTDAMDLIEYVHSKDFLIQVNTNATMLSESDFIRLSKLQKLHNLKMSISLDGCRKESHELIRGIDTFDLTISNIQKLCSLGVFVAVNMFVHAGNINEIKETMLLALSKGVQGFNCLNMMNVGRGNTEIAKKSLVPVSLSEFYRKVNIAIKDDDRLQKLMLKSLFANQLMGVAGGVKSLGCGVGTNRAIYLKADGSLYPCADTSIPDFYIGNLLSEKLSDLWENSPLLKKLRSLNIDSMNDKCKICDFRYYCAGGCRGENYQTTKNLYSPHYKCKEMRESVLELMWIITETPDLFKIKVDDLHRASSHVASA
ncbi:MAG: radical SAM protein, partial [archaeon]